MCHPCRELSYRLPFVWLFWQGWFITTSNDWVNYLVLLYACFLIINAFHHKIYTYIPFIIKKGKIIMKSLDYKPKKPKNRNEFWDVFLKNINILHDNQDELKDKFNRDKWGKRVYIVIAVGMIILTAYNVNLHQIEVEKIPEIKESNVIADGYICRYNDTESFLITIRNVGDKSADNLQIEVDFPPNMTISDIENNRGTPTVETEGGITYSYYYPRYACIKVNETIKFNILLNNKDEDFIITENWAIEPYRMQIWADDDEIPISIDVHR